MEKNKKIFIMVVATIVCVLGGFTSNEPLNYVLWWLMFVLVVFA